MAGRPAIAHGPQQLAQVRPSHGVQHDRVVELAHLAGPSPLALEQAEGPATHGSLLPLARRHQ
eukprot:1756920-Lingulodinium_polyedra.AAC.1